MEIVDKHSKELDEAIVEHRDYNFDYFGFKTLERSYLLRLTQGKRMVERPSHLWMRVSLGIHGEDIKSAIESYNLMSQGFFTHATPTLFNAGTPKQQLASCLHADTLVTTTRGPIKISEIKFGDTVITHLNTLEKVTQLHKNELGDRTLYNVKVNGYPDLHITGNHPVWGKRSQLEEPCWIPTEEIVSGETLIASPCNFTGNDTQHSNYIDLESGDYSILDADLCKFLGYSYILGRISFNRSFVITFPEKEFEVKDFCLMVAKKHFTNDNLKSTEFTLEISGDRNMRFFSGLFENNEITNLAFSFNITQARNFLDGVDKYQERLSNFSKDSNLVFYLRNLFKNTDEFAVVDEMSISTKNVEHVYNIGVENTHSYCAGGVMVKNCFLLGIEDSMLGIYKCLTDCAMISKHAGGIGIHISDIRGSGALIKGTNGTADGIVKMLRVFNETARFSNQGSKRNGSFAVYLEPWHTDIYEFLELRKNSGDENLRCRDLFYALWVCDLFMETVEADKDWYLMTPDVSKNLTNVYGDEFKTLYNGYVEQGKYTKKVKARELWSRILVSQIETGMPYLLYKDSINEKSNMKNVGITKSSNLCVAPETLILTSNGYKPIYSLKGKSVDVWNGEEFSNVTVEKTGVNVELINVKLSNGLELNCTPYHKFHTTCGIVEAKDLKESHHELIECKFPVVSISNPAKDEFSIIGSIDKCYPPINGNVTERIEYISKLTECTETKFFKNTWYNCFVLCLSCEYSYVASIIFMLQTLGCSPVIKETVIDKKLINYNILITSGDIRKLNRLGFTSWKNVKEYSTLHSALFTESTMKKANFNENETNFCVTVKSVTFTGRKDDSYCFTEKIKGMGVFNGILTGNCAEILIPSDTDEYGTCNISTVGLSKYVIKGETPRYDFKKLYNVVRVMTKNMNRVIDENFYPVGETKKSNFKHRPIAIGVQGLANAFFEMGYPFESVEAKILNKKIFETIQFACITESKELSKIEGPYSSFEGSPISQGKFQHNLWGLENSELSGLWDWDNLKEEVIKYGVRNALMTACPPTASTSQILGNFESFEPVTSNIFMRSTLSGDYPIINKYLVRDLEALDLWTDNVKEKLVFYSGSIQAIEEIPSNIKKLYKTVWEIPQKTLMELSADRSVFIDHTQSFNLYMTAPSVSKLTSAHFYGWKLKLKTGQYYLRSKPASKAQQFTVSTKTQNAEKKLQEEKIKKLQEEKILEQMALSCSIKNPESCDMCSG
jgi:ribonucleotide reductase alpha subunit